MERPTPVLRSDMRPTDMYAELVKGLEAYAKEAARQARIAVMAKTYFESWIRTSRFRVVRQVSVAACMASASDGATTKPVDWIDVRPHQTGNLAQDIYNANADAWSWAERMTR
jgi:hypothetical protein